MTVQPSIFITGAGAGIGAETARLFAANGWRVGASDVNAATLDALVSGLAAGCASAHAADVRDAAAVQSAVDDFVRLAGGRLDAVFANAGVLFMGPHETISTERKNLLVDVNVKGVIHTLDAAFPHLAATPGAHAVTMCSTSAEYGSPQHAVYSATKFFVRGLTEALNVEYREHDIQVSAVFVSYVRTGMVLDAAVKPASIERMGVKITPDQVARTVWRAVHGKRVHWRVGLDARLVNAAVRLLGAGVAPIYARLTRE